ncbi:hypothetical protein PAMP_004875 [Pampus punctatissimus]
MDPSQADAYMNTESPNFLPSLTQNHCFLAGSFQSHQPCSFHLALTADNPGMVSQSPNQSDSLQPQLGSLFILINDQPQYLLL